MKKIDEAGVEVQYAPCTTGENLNENFENGIKFLLASIRKQVAEHGELFYDAVLADKLFKTLFPNTELGVDLKLLTLESGRLAVGGSLPGVIFRIDDYDYVFVQAAESKKEMASEKEVVKRNPHVYVGDHITYTCRDNVELRPNFKPMVIGGDFCIEAYALAVANELIAGYYGFIEKKSAKE